METCEIFGKMRQASTHSARVQNEGNSRLKYEFQRAFFNSLKVKFHNLSRGSIKTPEAYSSKILK